MKRSRRGFLAAATAVPLVPSVLAPQPSPAPGTEAREALAEALTEAARRRFAPHLTADDAQEVRKAIVDNLRAAERLRALGLGNSDEPVTVFEATPTAVRPTRPRRHGGPEGRRS